MVYVETSAILNKAANKEKLEGEAIISDVVLAEIHNLDEPWRDWCARLLKENPPPNIRIEQEEVEFARKYVYNKVLSKEDYIIGLHYILACLRGAKKLMTCNPLFAEKKEELDRINRHFKKPTIEIELVECTKIPEETLKKVRSMAHRLLETQGPVKLVQALRESQEFFQKEKELKIRRISRID